MLSSFKHYKVAESIMRRAQAAFDRRNYEEAIKIASTGIDTLPPKAESAAQLYYIRAMSKGKIAKFQAAEADGFSIIRMDATSVHGHLCLAKLYAMQGKQKKCIEICDRAFKVLLRREDPIAEKHLLNIQAKAEKRLRTRIDLVNFLPQELLVLVLEPLSTEELATVALVSESWYTQVTQCKPLWRSAHISTDDKATWLVIPSIGHHVWNVFYSSGSQRILDLQSQDVTEEDAEEQALLYREEVNYDYRGKFDSTYSMYHFGFYWHMVSVFAAFPNLKRLKFNGGPPAAHCEGITMLPPHLHLTTLDLNVMMIHQCEHLEMILRRCPSIRRLSISNCGWRIVEIIEQLATLDVLVVHFHQPLMTLQHRLMNTICIEENPPKGLRSLALEAASQEYSQQRARFTCYDISGLVANNCDILEELIITCTKEHDRQLFDEMSRTIQWGRILSAQYPSLQRLCCIIPESKENELAALIHRCDSLVDCSIVHPAVIPEIVLDALSTKRSLRRLELTFGIDGEIDDLFFGDHLLDGIGIEELEALSGLPSNGFQRLLRRTSEGLNGLQHICFKDCTLIVPSILDILATSTLRGTEFCSTIFSYESIRDFVYRSDRSSSLEWVIFDAIVCADENGEEWILGMRYELLALRLGQLFQAPTLLGEDHFITLVNRKKHKDLAFDLLNSGGVISDITPRDIIYTFLENTLRL